MDKLEGVYTLCARKRAAPAKDRFMLWFVKRKSCLIVNQDHPFTPLLVYPPYKLCLIKSKQLLDNKKGGNLNWHIPEFNCGDGVVLPDKSLDSSSGQLQIHFGRIHVSLFKVATQYGFTDCFERGLAAFVIFSDGNIAFPVLVNIDFTREASYYDIKTPADSQSFVIGYYLQGQ